MYITISWFVNIRDYLLILLWEMRIFFCIFIHLFHFSHLLILPSPIFSCVYAMHILFAAESSVLHIFFFFYIQDFPYPLLYQVPFIPISYLLSCFGEANFLIIYWSQFSGDLKISLLSYMIGELVKYRILDFKIFFSILKALLHCLSCCYWEVGWHFYCKFFIYDPYFSSLETVRNFFSFFGVLKFHNNVSWFRSFFKREILVKRNTSY